MTVPTLDGCGDGSVSVQRFFEAAGQVKGAGVNGVPGFSEKRLPAELVSRAGQARSVSGSV